MLTAIAKFPLKVTISVVIVAVALVGHVVELVVGALFGTASHLTQEVDSFFVGVGKELMTLRDDVVQAAQDARS